jgi:hypothetical protein
VYFVLYALSRQLKHPRRDSRLKQQYCEMVSKRPHIGFASHNESHLSSKTLVLLENQ